MAVSVLLKKGDPSVSTRDRHRFGWLTIEGADLPFIVREAKDKFLPVKLIEKRLLSYYPSAYPTEIRQGAPLVCHYMKQEEADLLNKCCRKRPDFDDQFENTDPVVKLHDFLQFFGVVKKAYPDVVVGRKGSPAPPPAPAPAPAPDYGWVLVKDAMVPYVVRGDSRMAPLNVIRGAARLLIGAQVDNACAGEAEVTCMNTMCEKVGLMFTFQPSTALIDLENLVELEPACQLEDLPRDSPMDCVSVVGDGNHGESKPANQGGKRTGESSASRSLQALANMAKVQQASRQTAAKTQVPKGNSVKAAVAGENAGRAGAPVVAKVQLPAPSRVSQRTKTQTPKAAAIAAKRPRPVAGRTVIASAGGDVDIRPRECYGKTISCLVRGRAAQPYALVEAVSRVYFPTSSLLDFIHFLENDLAVTLYVLKKSEEEAFIEFYGIPTKQLRCNQVIRLQDLLDRMPHLQRHFEAPSADKPANGDVRSDAAQVTGSRGNSPSLPEANGLDTGRRNKNLENTISRLFKDKQVVTAYSDADATADADITADATDDDIPEVDVSDDGPDDLLSSVVPTDDTLGGDSPRPAANKRKAPPRRCCPKKLTLLIDGVQTDVEQNSGFTEDSDLEEYD